jgi:NarL family two-component system sensor histidine kinase YdfH
MLEQQQASVLSHERQRMARDLHDTLAQGVAGIILQLEATKPYLAANDGERVHQIVDGTLHRARATLQEARAAIADLRVTINLQNRVSEQIEHFQHLTAIPCEVTQQELECDDPRVNEIAPSTLAEGLANIAQHAHASHVAVSIIQSKQALTLQIQDNGCGFDARKTPAPGHFGLLGMRERIYLIGGQFSLESAVGQGTCLQVHLPLAEVA